MAAHCSEDGAEEGARFAAPQPGTGGSGCEGEARGLRVTMCQR